MCDKVIRLKFYNNNNSILTLLGLFWNVHPLQHPVTSVQSEVYLRSVVEHQQINTSINYYTSWSIQFKLLVCVVLCHFQVL
jgi:hypothetical protein